MIKDAISPYVNQYFYRPLEDMSLTRSFLRHYKFKADNELKLHTDDSYITVSLCILNETEEDGSNL